MSSAARTESTGSRGCSGRRRKVFTAAALGVTLVPANEAGLEQPELVDEHCLNLLALIVAYRRPRNVALQPGRQEFIRKSLVPPAEGFVHLGELAPEPGPADDLDRDRQCTGECRVSSPSGWQALSTSPAAAAAVWASPGPVSARKRPVSVQEADAVPACQNNANVPLTQH